MRTARFSMLKSLLFGTAVTVLALGCGGDEPTPRVSNLPDTPPPKVKKLAMPDAGMTVIPPPQSVSKAPQKPVPPPVVMPADYDGRMKLAKQLVQDGRVDDAEDVYLGAIELAPDKAAPRIEVARLRLGKGDARSARKHAEKAVELLPESSSAWNTMGRVELMERDLDAAIDAFAKAVELDEDNVWAWNNLGLSLTEAGRNDEAADALETATALDGAEPYMWNNLGVAYERLDRLEEARAAYKQGQKRGSESARLSLARLDGKTQKPQASVDPAVVTPVTDEDEGDDGDDEGEDDDDEPGDQE